MSRLCLYAPSKTFLLGEYAVLSGGRSILLATNPGFSLEISLSQLMSKASFLQQIGQAKGSPADVLWGDNCPLLHSVKSPGKGFGGSSAFAWFALITTQYKRSGVLACLDNTYFTESYSYLKDCTQGVGSGADMASQYYGYVCITDLHDKCAGSFTWPFAEVDFVIVQTGRRCSTPDHLTNLSVETAQLQCLVDQGIEAFEQVNLPCFLEVIVKYQACLKQQGLLLASSELLLDVLLRMPGYLAAKACGAMGAETIVVLFKGDCRDRARRFLNQHGMGIHCFSDQLSRGLHAEVV